MMTQRLLARLALVIGAAPLAAVACGGSVDNSTDSTSAGGSSASGAGGAAAGQGGSPAGSGGSSAGTGGSPAGSGGTAAGTGGSTAGSGGAVAGSAGATACQRPLPPSTAGSQPFCHALSECPVQGGGYVCTATEKAPGCTGPEPPQCQSDEACGPGSVCQENYGQKYCQTACVSDDTCSPARKCDKATGHCVDRPCDDATPCPETAYCSAAKTCQLKQCDPAQTGQCITGHACDPKTFSCSPKPCTTEAECPPDNFVCEAGACARKKCACDTECGAKGYCLVGLCDENPGTCYGGVACGRPLLIDDLMIAAAIAAGSAWA